MWYHCTICRPEDPKSITEEIKGVVLYTRLNTSSVRNHAMSMNTREHKAFTGLYDGNMWDEREETLVGQGKSQLRLKVEYRSSSISCVSDYMIATKKYKKCHKQKASFEENIVAFMEKAYTPLSLVDCQ